MTRDDFRRICDIPGCTCQASQMWISKRQYAENRDPAAAERPLNDALLEEEREFIASHLEGGE